MRHIDELDKEIKELQRRFSEYVHANKESEYWREQWRKQQKRADTLAEAIINSEADRNIQLDHT